MSDIRKRTLNFFWPKIEFKEQAESLVRMAAGFCVFISSFSLGASLLYKYEYVNVPAFQSAWMSVFIYGPLAYFIHEKEKIAAWTGLIYYAMDQLYMMTSTGGKPSLLMVVIICGFISAIRALNFLAKNPEALKSEDLPSENKVA